MQPTILTSTFNPMSSSSVQADQRKLNLQTKILNGKQISERNLIREMFAKAGSENQRVLGYKYSGYNSGSPSPCYAFVSKLRNTSLGVDIPLVDHNDLFFINDCIHGIFDIKKYYPVDASYDFSTGKMFNSFSLLTHIRFTDKSFYMTALSSEAIRDAIYYIAQTMNPSLAVASFPISTSASTTTELNNTKLTQTVYPTSDCETDYANTPVTTLGLAAYAERTITVPYSFEAFCSLFDYEEPVLVVDYNAQDVNNVIGTNISDEKIQTAFNQSETVYLKTTDGQITPIVDNVYPLSRLLEETPDLTAKTVFETDYADLERDIESYYFQLNSVYFKGSDSSMIFAANTRTASIQSLLDPKLPNMIITHVQDVTYPMLNGFNVNMRMWETDATLDQFLGFQSDYTDYEYSDAEIIDAINGLTRASLVEFIEDWTIGFNNQRPNSIRSYVRYMDGKEAPMWNGYENISALVAYTKSKVDPSIIETPERKRIFMSVSQMSTDTTYPNVDHVLLNLPFVSIQLVGKKAHAELLRDKYVSLIAEVGASVDLFSNSFQLMFEVNGGVVYPYSLRLDVQNTTLTLEEFTASSNGGGSNNGDTLMRNPKILAQQTIGEIHYLHLAVNPVLEVGGLKAPIGSRAVFITPENVALCFFKEGLADNAWKDEPIGDFADRMLSNLVGTSINVNILPDQDGTRNIGQPDIGGKRFNKICANSKLLVGELHIDNESAPTIERQVLNVKGEIHDKDAHLIFKTTANGDKDQNIHFETNRKTEFLQSSYSHVKGELGAVLEMTSWGDERKTFLGNAQTSEMVVAPNAVGSEVGPHIFSHPKSVMKLNVITHAFDTVTKKVAILERIVAVKTDVDGNVNNIISVQDSYTAKESGMEIVDVDFLISVNAESGKSLVQLNYVANEVGGSPIRYVTSLQTLSVLFDKADEL